MKNVAVLGAGSWGTALASVLAENGNETKLYARRSSAVQEINTYHTNEHYLPNASLAPSLQASDDLSEVIQPSDVVVFVVPSQSLRETARSVRPYLKPHSVIVHASKGLEIHTFKRMSQVLAEELPEHANQIVALTGPSHAEEVIQKLPTAVVVASVDQHAAEVAQSCFMNSYFRVYTNTDVIGCEIGGALKNVIALATGLCSGMEFGDNGIAALLTRGLAEMARLGFAMGAQPNTFVGLAGVGDLIATCTSPHSRNWRAGNMISQGKKLDQVLSEMGMVVEGVKTTEAAYTMAKHYQVEMPITEQLYEVLFADKCPREALMDLMSRDKTHELQDYVQGWS
ncbi:glycerol-3-phosphate dehydrogenase (NAD(P)+) [Croceifilum oryzae]|uniref:Glycerol-3-phosphate dehydrogenase [NAD(P)+] n=1 Tax=Croceifilum oryzae TaxID=1553429 RepID=A0AAJ1TGG4_9BACL|nr:NAD(P)H-dependent glycerol-3-phosphate dehydrogenase [Croceifilum oryzae]MDQ0418044.1 glycerol-3-phosphate dehydrogenase (NAD(P)+) [Croceifilum oryzae]